MHRLTLICVILLAGCRTDPAGELFDGYLQQLAHAAGVAVRAVEGPAHVAYPRPRERRLDVPEVRGGLLDIVRLAECGVAPLIVERNSILGRHADHAALLGNSGALYVRLSACAERLAEEAGDNDEDAARKQLRVQEIVDAKEPAVHALTWNASFGSEAMALFWRRAQSPLAPQEDPGARAADAEGALRDLRRAVEAALDGHVDDAQRAFSDSYRRLEQAPWGGAWLRAAERAAHSLSVAEHTLQSLDLQRLCPDGGASERARQLRSVHEQHYVARVMPYVAAIDQGMGRVAPQLEALWAMQRVDAAPAVAAFRDRSWRDDPGSLHGRLQQAVREHDNAWDALQHACAMY